METYTAKKDQSIFDLAVQLYGDPTMVFKIMADNPSIPCLHFDLNGFAVQYDETITNSLSVYIAKNAIEVATGHDVVEEVQTIDAGQDVAYDFSVQSQEEVQTIDGGADEVLDPTSAVTYIERVDAGSNTNF